MENEKKEVRGIFKGAVFSMLVKVAAVGAGFGFNWFLARKLGASGTGLFFLAFSGLSILSILSKRGLDRTVLRFISSYVALGEWHKARAVQQYAFKKVLIFGGISSIALWLLSEPLAEYLYKQTEIAPLIRIMAFAVLPLALLQNTCESLKGIGKVQLGLILYGVVVPILATLVFYLFYIGYSTDYTAAAFGYLFASWLSLALTSYFWWLYTHKEAAPQPEAISTQELQASSRPMFWSSVFQQGIMWLPTTFMPLFLVDTADIGQFEIAKRTAQLTAFFLVAFNSILAPKIAAMYAKGELGKIQRISRKTTLMISALASPVFIAFIFFPDFFMSLFGKGFNGGSDMLRYMTIGQFVNVLCGPVGFLLMMSGHERKMRNSIFISLLVLAATAFALMPIYGARGAAIAVMTAMIVQNLVAVFQVWKAFRIVTLPFILAKTPKA